MSPCTGVILAGGKATRYGGLPKGLERVGGNRIIDRVAAALAEVTDELLLIANDPAAEDWLPGVDRASDVLPDLGSLGGIHAAIVRAGGPALVVAWDMPFVPSGLLRVLRDVGERPGTDAAVPESGSRRGVEPLCAYYTPGCIPAIERRLELGDRRVIGFYDDVQLVRIDAATVATFGDADFLFMNVNTPDDLALADQHAAATDGDRRRQEAQR